VERTKKITEDRAKIQPIKWVRHQPAAMKTIRDYIESEEGRENAQRRKNGRRATVSSSRRYCGCRSQVRLAQEEVSVPCCGDQGAELRPGAWRSRIIPEFWLDGAVFRRIRKNQKSRRDFPRGQSYLTASAPRDGRRASVWRVNMSGTIAKQAGKIN